MEYEEIHCSTYDSIFEIREVKNIGFVPMFFVEVSDFNCFIEENYQLVVTTVFYRDHSF